MAKIASRLHYCHRMDKTCSDCNLTKPVTEFYRRASRPETQLSGWTGACRECIRVRQNAYFGGLSAERRRELTQGNRFRRRRITPTEGEAMAVAQGGVCAICGERAVDRLRPGKKSPLTAEGLQVDHCHNSNVVRGLLCKPCNTALGCMKDNVEWIRRMADYIEARTPLTKMKD